jgi:microcompartment protein CcmL/EutN
VGELVSVHVIPPPHVNIDLVFPLGRCEQAKAESGGKGYFSMTSELYQVQAAVDAAAAAAGRWLVGTEVIPRPHEDTWGFLETHGRAP